MFFRLRAQITPKFVFGQGFAPNPAGGAYDAFPEPQSATELIVIADVTI